LPSTASHLHDARQEQLAACEMIGAGDPKRAAFALRLMTARATRTTEMMAVGAKRGAHRSRTKATEEDATMNDSRLSPTMLALFAALTLVAGCAPRTEPPELRDARAAFASVSSGGASEFAPIELDHARIALAAAEDEYHRHPGSRAVVDLAYVAQRKSQAASVASAARTAEQNRARALAQQARAAEALRLQPTRDVSSTHSAQPVSPYAGEQPLGAEQRASTERARVAIDRIRDVADVRETVRGVVITLASRALFANGQAVLLPAAQERLGLVAAMLHDMRDRTIQVDGHADDAGETSGNYALSLARAEAVREFLTAHGVEPERIHATGFGASRPVADTATASSGNEIARVEIVLEPLVRNVGGGPQ
jgi:outer membrane protein OmpA-like peptidoglycan-associated protein